MANKYDSNGYDEEGYDKNNYHKKGGIQAFGGKYSGVERNKKKNGVISFYINYKSLDKTPKRVKVGDSPVMTKTKALKRLRDVTLEINDARASIKDANENGVYIPKRKKRTYNATTTIKELAEYYLEKKSKSKDYFNVASKYKNHIEHEAISNIPIILITRDDIENFVKNKQKTLVQKNGQQRKQKKRSTRDKSGVIEYIETIEENKSRQYTLSNATVYALFSLIVTIINYASKDEKYIGRNPFILNQDDSILEEIKVPTAIKIKMLSVKEKDCFLAQLKAQSIAFEKADKYVYLIGLLAVYTGARRNTILNIKVEDIDLENNTLVLYNLKVKNRAYYVKIPSETISKLLIKFSKDKLPNDYLFTSVRTQKQITKYPAVMKKILDLTVNNHRSDGNKMTLRDLRNSLASYLAHKDVDLYKISRLLDHDSIMNTKRYAQLQNNSASEVVEDYAKEGD
jgi:integrase